MNEPDVEAAGRILRQARGKPSLVCTPGICLKDCSNRGMKCKNCFKFSNYNKKGKRK